MVIKWHRRESDQGGLQQAGKVAQKVYAWALQEDRIASALEDLGADGRLSLLWIYASGRRGLKESEILNAHEAPLHQVQFHLSKAEHALFCCVRDGESQSYHGFGEMASRALPALVAEFLPGEATGPDVHWLSYRHFLTAHLNHFLAQVALGHLRMTQGGELHRKNLQELAQRFEFSSPVSTVTAEEEALWLLRFAAEEGLVQQDDGRLILTREAREMLFAEDAPAVTERLRRYWFEKRARGLSEVLHAWAAAVPEHGSQTGVRMAHAVKALWAPSGSLRHRPKDKKTLFTWEHLPKSLQELWLLGCVEFGLVKGRLGYIKLDAHFAAGLRGESHPASLAENPSPVAMPNFEVLAPVGMTFHRQHHLELTARRQNDELLTRYRFTKESVIEGLQSGLEMSRFQDLIAWLGFSPMGMRSLTEWGSSFASTRFREVLLLEVKDAERLRELIDIPQLREWVQEVIPGFGFVVLPRHKQAVRELLHHFGLIPGEEYRAAEQPENLTLPVIDPAPFPAFDAGEVAYREVAPILRPGMPNQGAATPDEHDKYDQGRRVASIEQAIAREHKVEFMHARVPGKRVVAIPRAVLKTRQPMKMIGVDMESGHRQEWLLDDMLHMRVLTGEEGK